MLLNIGKVSRIMDNIRYLLAASLGFMGIWILIINWRIFWSICIKKKKAPSWTPLLSGALLCSAFVLLPYNPYRWLWWVAFLIDWGSLPGIVSSIFVIVYRAKKH